MLTGFPQLVDYEAFRLRRTDLRQVPEIVMGQLAVASYSPSGSLHDATGVRIPGVLDDVYSAATERSLGVTWKLGKPTLRVWAPTAQEVKLKVWHGSSSTKVAMTRNGDGTWAISSPRARQGAQYVYDVKVWAPAAGAVVRNRVTDPYAVGFPGRTTAVFVR